MAKRIDLNKEYVAEITRAKRGEQNAGFDWRIVHSDGGVLQSGHADTENDAQLAIEKVFTDFLAQQGFAES